MIFDNQILGQYGHLFFKQNIAILCFFFTNLSFGQEPHLEHRVKRIDSLMNMYYSNEVAEKEVNGLYNLFLQKYTGIEYENLRIKVMLQKAILYALDNKHHKALEIALEASDRANKYGLAVEIYHCSWIIAIIYEVVGDFKSCREYLDKAYRVYQKYKLDSVYSIYCVRISSYYKLTQKPDSALHYAYTALKLAKKYNNSREERDAYLLLGTLLSKSKYQEAVKYKLLSAQKFAEIKDFNSAASQFTWAARILLDNNLVEEAFVYSDSAIYYLEKSEMLVNPKIYLVRSNLFETIGNVDSSFYYFRKYHEAYAKELANMETFEIKKIDEKYQSEKRDAIIKKRNQWLVLSVLVVILITVLAILLFRKNQRIHTQKVLIDSQLSALQELLAHKQKLAESKSQFYANASHELRTPLAMILGPLDSLLKKENLNEQQKRQLLYIAREGGITLKNLISQILDLSKLDGGNMYLYLKPTRVYPFFENWLIQFESMTHTKRLQFIVENHITEDLVVMLDREKCRQIMSNLISNALKFTEREGKVHVTVGNEKNALKFCVSDTGRGIDADDIPYIFDRYFQANNKDELAQGGMGVGLALCRDYVELMGGTIGVESTLGVGTSFVVEFPVEITVEKPEEEFIAYTETAKQEPMQNMALLERPAVLVVEDNYTLQKYLHLLLSEEYQVLLADNGEDALEVVHADKNINLIISDLMMPVMDGYQLLDALKANENTAGIPVIMLTARAEKDAKLKALKIGVDDYMTKPFNEEELKVRISNLLKNYTIRKQAIEEEEVNTLSIRDKEWMEGFDGYIRKIYLNYHISILDIASDFAMSESSLLRRLKRATGLSPQQYIQEIRLQQSLTLLSNKSNDYSVQQVALKVGYKDSRSFSRAFKNRFGKLPSEVIQD